MAFTLSDLDAIERAMASGELAVWFADGRRVEYRSMDDLLKARDAIKEDLASAATGFAKTRCTYGKFSKG